MERPSLSHPVRLAGHSLMRMQSDARLTELARAGHEPAFTAIVQRYRSALVRYCIGLLGADRAEDAVQQALANAHAALSAPDDRPLELRPWLYRLAHNAALNVLRASRDTATAPEAPAQAGEAPDEVLARRQRLDELLAAIAALPRAQRDSLLLRELEGRSHEEIASALGMSVGAARQQVFRARAAVRAACTALTPAPLLTRLLELAAAPAAGSGAEVGGAVLVKAAAGLLAAGALAGGATSTGVLSGDDRARAPEERAPAAAPETVAKTSATEVAPRVAERPEPVSVARHRAARHWPRARRSAHSRTNRYRRQGRSGPSRESRSGPRGHDGAGPGPGAADGGDDDRRAPSSPNGDGDDEDRSGEQRGREDESDEDRELEDGGDGSGGERRSRREAATQQGLERRVDDRESAERDERAYEGFDSDSDEESHDDAETRG